MDLKNLNVGIVGGGVMAENILRGILTAGLLSKEQIIVSDLRPERISHIKNSFEIRTTLDNHELISKAELLILAVKPQNMRGLLHDVKKVVDDSKLVLSIAAGIKAETIFQGLDKKGRIIRIMPNIGAKVLASASVLCLGPSSTASDLNLARLLFDAIGQTVVIDEDLMDAVTALSGSGPAYIFMIIDALADAGVKAGLSRGIALKLAAQTCFGAAKLVIETDALPAQLKDQVTSPGGTTIAGIHALEKGALRGIIMDGVEAAFRRARELSTL
jgi:pyrroline-5-carboxylate reductase